MANIHVVIQRNGSWAVKSAGASRAGRVFPRQSDAIRSAREMAQRNKGELYIHSSNGMIRERLSYGKDQFPPKG